MKIYGVTVIDTDDCGITGVDGKESETYLFKDEEEQYNEAWNLFKENFEYDLENDRIDESIEETRLPEKETFFLNLKNSGYYYYVRYNSSYQVEVFEAEL